MIFRDYCFTAENVAKVYSGMGEQKQCVDAVIHTHMYMYIY